MHKDRMLGRVQKIEGRRLLYQNLPGDKEQLECEQFGVIKKIFPLARKVRPGETFQYFYALFSSHKMQMLPEHGDY